MSSQSLLIICYQKKILSFVLFFDTNLSFSSPKRTIARWTIISYTTSFNFSSLIYENSSSLGSLQQRWSNSSRLNRLVWGWKGFQVIWLVSLFLWYIVALVIFVTLAYFILSLDYSFPWHNTFHIHYGF